ncbi:MAG: flagellar biosynthesis protein FliQ [Gammaproteobacteria bacterium]|jgi:flagellar biosynthetic protein FliQ|nr:flagellar biosynthesis protein FliQ [Gammaproteobacteria bacterium]
MTPETVITVGKEALEVCVLLLAVLLLPALAVGLLVSMFQAATQINEVTLSFVPKLLVTLLTFIVAGPWLLERLVDYMRRLIESIPVLIG